MDPPALDPKEFKNAIENYKPQIRDFFAKGSAHFSNYTHITQGEVGDCWLLAPIAAIARSPMLRTILEHNFITNKNNTYTITVYDAHGNPKSIDINGKLVYIPKDGEFKADLLFAGQQQFLPEMTNVPLKLSWFAFLEKAVAIMYGGYEHLDGGDPDSSDVKQAALGFMNITGKKATTIMIDGTTDFKTVKHMLDKGAAIVYTSKTNKELPKGKKLKKTPESRDSSKYNLLEDHAYVVESISDEGVVTLYNPHGHLKHNIAKPMPNNVAVLFGKRLDILMSKSGEKRKTRKRSTLRSKQTYRK